MGLGMHDPALKVQMFRFVEPSGVFELIGQRQGTRRFARRAFHLWLGRGTAAGVSQK